MNPKLQISVQDPISDPNMGIILHHGYGCGYVELPKGFRIIGQWARPNLGPSHHTNNIMFRCSNKPVLINTGAFPIYEYRVDLVWDSKNSFLVDQDRYELTTDVTCKPSGIYIFYGKQNVKEPN